MWYLGTVAEPAAEPITLAEAKTQCRVDGSDSDADLNGLIAAARSHVEGYCGAAFAERDITVKCDSFHDFAVLPFGPVTAVGDITYVDIDGATQTLDTAVYEVRSDGITASIVLAYGQSWPSIQSGSRITVAATVGYDGAPAAVKQAMLMLISHWFDNRSAGGSSSEVPHSVDALLSNHRIFAR